MSERKLLRSGWFWFSIIWAAFIFFVSVIPAVDLPSISIWESDKLAHAIVYCILTISVAFTIRKSRPDYGITRTIIITAVLCISYSLAIEILQDTPLVSRSFDILDIVANCIGTGLGTVILLNRFKWEMVKKKN
ncbi:MAG: VanZ family protein [Fimbriimonadaceae bacterium]|nr:VanZ family protein [Chitinophagales bacterium]